MNESVTLLNPPIEAVPHDERPPDASHVATIATVGDWHARALSHLLGDRTAGAFQVVFAQSALDGIHLHGQGAPDIEVCGVLVGHGCRDASGDPYLLISHVVRGSAAASRTTNVTFTADTWLHIQTVMDNQYPDEKIVGWYHTHPGFGIFLSEMDVFICQHFFNLAWQCAFVYDPQSGEEGNFVWHDGVPTREAVLIEDDVTPKAARIPLIAKSDAMAAAPTDYDPPAAPEAPDFPDARVDELLQRVERLEWRQRLLTAALAFVTAFGVMLGVMFLPLPTPPPAAPPRNLSSPGLSRPQRLKQQQSPSGKPRPGPGGATPTPDRELPEVIRPS